MTAPRSRCHAHLPGCKLAALAAASYSWHIIGPASCSTHITQLLPQALHHHLLSPHQHKPHPTRHPTPQVIGILAFFKYGATRFLIGHTNMGVAWLFNTLFSLALVAGSSFLVVGFAPSAQGSGVPEVMAYLNGCLIPKVGGLLATARASALVAAELRCCV